MPTKSEDDVPELFVQNSVPGYSGSPHEGKGPPNTVPTGSPTGTVASNCGICVATKYFKGDGVTVSPGGGGY